MSVNKAILVGSVGRDPEVKHFDGGAVKASFPLATSERFKSKSGEYEEQTEWHNIVCWGRTAEMVEKYVAKGTQLYVEGKIQTRSWEGQDGNKRYTTEINAMNVQFVGKKSDNPANSTVAATPLQAEAQSGPSVDIGKEAVGDMSNFTELPF